MQRPSVVSLARSREILSCRREVGTQQHSGDTRHRVLPACPQENKLSGSMPDAFGGLRKIEHWDTYGNQLTGDLPPSIMNASTRECATHHVTPPHTRVRARAAC